MNRFLELSQPRERDLDSPETVGTFLPPVAPTCGRPSRVTADRLSHAIDVLAGLEHLPARKLRRMIRLRLARLRAERIVTDLRRGS
jgi:hypothetical protein